MDMDSARAKHDLPIVSGKIALMGSFVSRLVAFCLLYFAPVLAYEQGVPVSGSGVDRPTVAESLDPKHQKDHDPERESERGRAQFQDL